MTIQASDYAIRGGLEGRERLRVLGRIMHPSTAALFDRLGLGPGLTCLDVGCGGGDVTLELARRVAPGGRVVGVDLDEEKVRIARSEAQQHGIAGVEFRVADIRELRDAGPFDVVYARFLLTHLSDPEAAVRSFHEQLRPGGTLVVEDIDFSGHFTYPDSAAFHRYRELYCTTVTRRGGDPNIGPRLPLLLKQQGFSGVGLHLVQPTGMEGDVKLISGLTLENIAGAVLQDGLASRQEIDDLVQALYAFAADPLTLSGMPRVFQVWGRRD
jgi:SAM-dependent methyltransferase